MKYAVFGSRTRHRVRATLRTVEVGPIMPFLDSLFGMFEDAIIVVTGSSWREPRSRITIVSRLFSIITDQQAGFSTPCSMNRRPSVIIETDGK